MFYGTHYTPEDLDAWHESDIAEALAYADIVMKQQTKRDEE